MATRKKAEKIEEPKAPEAPKIIKPGSVLCYTLAGSRMRFENIVQFGFKTEGGVMSCWMLSTENKLRVMQMQPGLVVEWQPAEE